MSEEWLEWKCCISEEWLDWKTKDYVLFQRTAFESNKGKDQGWCVVGKRPDNVIIKLKLSPLYLLNIKELLGIIRMQL